jgi:hypothetical protein
MLPDTINKTLAQLQAQLIPTKRAALIAINGSDKTSYFTVTNRKDGQIESKMTVRKDIESGEIMSTEIITWTYYENEKGCPVDTITITDTVGKLVTTKVIKHYVDGKQPEVINGLK